MVITIISHKMTLTQQEINRYNNWMEGLKKDIKSNKPYAEKKYLQEFNNMSIRDCYSDSNTNNYNAPSYHSNYYSSNNVNITGNNIGNNVCCLF